MTKLNITDYFLIRYLMAKGNATSPEQSDRITDWARQEALEALGIPLE